jgi:MinD-like ATPase involved in chromosome partitioning or flagellar assembly
MSVNRGVPFVVSDPARPISQAIIRLAQNLLETWAAAEAAAVESPVDDTDRRRLGRFFR